jgi:hypothetical protein
MYAYNEMESAAIYSSIAPTCPFQNVYGYITDTKMHYAVGGSWGGGGGEGGVSVVRQPLRVCDLQETIQ